MSGLTPGPFSVRPSQHRAGDPVILEDGKPVALPFLHLDEAAAGRLVSLLNKGTHFDGMMELLREAREFVDHYTDGGNDPEGGMWPPGEFCANDTLQRIEAAIAKATTEGGAE